MKITLKFGSRRHGIDISDDATIVALKVKAAEVLDLVQGHWFLSLNGNDKLDALESSTVKEVGLVSGDLLYVVTMKPEHPLQPLLLEMGFHKDQLDDVLGKHPDIDVESAIEILSSVSGSEMRPAVQGSRRDYQTLPPPDPDSSSKVDLRTESRGKKPSLCLPAEDTSSSVVACTDVAAMPPLLIQDGVTRSLSDLFSSGQPSCGADALCIAIHAIMLEAGFKLNRDDVSGSDAPPSKCLGFPSGWKSAAMKFYRLQYVHYAGDRLLFTLTGTVLGSHVLISANVDDDDGDGYQLKLRISDYVGDSLDADPGSVYINLRRLSRQVKDALCTPLIAGIRQKLGLPQDTGLLALPVELKQMLFRYLDIRSLVRLSQVCRLLCAAASEDVVWTMVLARDFKASNPVGGSAREAVKMLHRFRKEERTASSRPRPPLRPDFEIERNPDLIFPDVSATMPGIIGGVHDLYPTGPFMPGGFPYHPHGLPRRPVPADFRPDTDPLRVRRPPGARFDPYGPTPDIDFPLPGRPRFPRGGGFGGNPIGGFF